MIRELNTVYTARGKKIRVWNPATDAKEEILKDVMGRSGNLRAPALKLGDALIVGFNDEMYAQHFG
jgi:hypothetical protein